MISQSAYSINLNSASVQYASISNQFAADLWPTKFSSTVRRQEIREGRRRKAKVLEKRWTKKGSAFIFFFLSESTCDLNYNEPQRETKGEGKNFELKLRSRD